MKRAGPLFTLVAGVALAAVLSGLSVRAASEDKTPAAASAPSATRPAAPAAQPTTAAPKPAATPPARANYAGYTSEGGGAAVAIAVRNNKAVAYVCDGKTIESWFSGPYNGGKLNLQGKNGATLTATVGDGRSFGTVELKGHTYPFTVRVATKPSGLYRATAPARKALEGGWIVLPGNRQYGVVDGAPAPVLDTTSKTATAADGGRLVAVPVDGVDGSGFTGGQ
ncbi:hypothetical protein ACRYCC_12200 [Actinomadura scrupuli]|uniref:hypothetical protein n=1 Tax=Actinomadura scrupuli TaxID=559629 RepID=UPI003D951602